MFIVKLTYTATLDRVDEALADHVVWLKQQFADGVFALSGRRVPRTGGVILTNDLSREDLLKRLESDPLNVLRLATYDIDEFHPSMSSSDLRHLLCGSYGKPVSVVLVRPELQEHTDRDKA